MMAMWKGLEFTRRHRDSTGIMGIVETFLGTAFAILGSISEARIMSEAMFTSLELYPPS
jgi:hypothetical protein